MLLAVSGNVTKKFYTNRAGEREISRTIIVEDILSTAGSLQPEVAHPADIEISDATAPRRTKNRTAIDGRLQQGRPIATTKLIRSRPSPPKSRTAIDRQRRPGRPIVTAKPIRSRPHRSRETAAGELATDEVDRAADTKTGTDAAQPERAATDV